MAVTIDGDRVWKRLQDLSQFRDPDSPGWTRRSFTNTYRQAREWLRAHMNMAGLEPRLDAAANLIGERTGTESRLWPLIVGSHSDTVMGGGRFDGMLGVVAAIEVAQSLKEQGMALRHPLWIVDFLAEEPSPYGISCVGSRGASGDLDASMLARVGTDGTTLAEGIEAMGGNASILGSAMMTHLAGYLELHIEQGPVLERAGTPLGVVTGIVGITRVDVTVKGHEGHAGTTPMSVRQDAMIGAAVLMQRFHAWVSAQADALVATFGTIVVNPNARNVIVGTARLGLEMRTLDDGLAQDAVERLKTIARDIEQEVRVKIVVDTVSQEPATVFLEQALTLLEESLASQQRAYRRLPSWAGHDAVYMRRVAPMTAMIFIPSHQGLSHCPEEWSDPQAVTAGVEALGDAVLCWDQQIDARPEAIRG